ncbi:MAG TPA: SRPBCC family protein [Sphingomicrobium sp.]|nr:SRPBCC family protein [Sphingomicrobium sp.]
MRIENSFDVPLSVADTWRTLLDIPAIAPCIPGVELVDATNGLFRGLGRVRLGPVQLVLKGEATLVEVDEMAHVATVKGRGRDEKGRGTTEASVRFNLIAKSSGVTTVATVSDIQLSGAIAQYGRASGVISEVAAQIVAQFASNLRTRLENQCAQADGGTADTTAVALAQGGAGQLSLVGVLLKSTVALVRRRFRNLFKRVAHRQARQ